MCSLDKTPSLQKYLGVGPMAGAGLIVFVTVMEWESWGKYEGVCSLHTVKCESGRLELVKME